MKVIKIIKCDESQAWYADHVGEEYEVYRETTDSYYVDESLYVLKEDATEIE